MIVIATVLFLAVVHAAPQDLGADVFDAEDVCLAQYPSLTRDFMEGLKQKKELPKDPTKDFKCFLACVGKKLEVMNHLGDLHFEGLKEITVAITAGDATHDDAHGMVTRCFDVQHDDDCEKAWKYVQCKIDELKPYKFSKGFCPSCTDRR